MTDKAWKATERRIARLVGGRRIGATGKATPDVISPWLVIEVKHRRVLPSWLASAVEQARQNAADTKLGIAVLHQAGERGDGDLVVMTMRDFREWFVGDVSQEVGAND